MVRIPLKKDDLVSKYIIDETIGDGASCVVYAAHYTDSSGFIHNVRLKECYPYGTEIKRNANAIVWQNKAEQTNALASFKIAYEKLLKMQNDNNVGNAHAHVFDLFEANNTLYSVMDVTNGVTFEIDNSDKLSDILKTILALTKVVEKYHASGYLHLDIKPGNFLVIPETRELVILFDVDSVTTIEDIKDGKIKCVPYSKNWAAPEQMQGQLGKLCPATDIYSIGAILFQKIMNRSVENSDMGIFANWNLDDIKMFENVNPAVKRLICDIFKHTLSANPKRRYQNTDKLISALEEAVETVRDGAPYIDSDCPAPNKNFIGREKEILDIEKSFKNGSNAVFIHGFGGIGKSELVKRYAQTHKKDYDAILFLSYENSLEELIEDINIVNCSDDKQHNKTLKKVLKQQKVLLIIDNFDVEIDEDDYLDNLLRFNANIIFTTRTDFSALTVDNTVQINIQALNKSELIDLFARECGRALDDAEKETVDAILENYNYYTLLVPIFARQLTASGWSLEQLKETTDKGLKAFEETEKIVVLKDGKLHKKTGLDMMRATFRVFGLSEIQKQVLINLYFLRFVKINKEQYRKYLWNESESKVKHIDAINDLLELGWIQKKNEWDTSEDVDLTIHPIIVEMIVCELEPDITKSDMLMSYMQDYLPWKELSNELFEGIDDWGNLHIDEIAHKLKWLCLFATSIDLGKINNLNYVVETLYKLLNGNIFVIQIIDYWAIKGLLDKLSTFIDNETITEETKFRLLNVFEIYWIERFIPRIGLKEDEQQEIKENVYNYFHKTHNIMKSISSPEKENFITCLCKPIVQYLAQYNRQMYRDIYDVICENEEVWNHILEDCDFADWKIEEDSFIENSTDDNATHQTKKHSSDAIVLNKDTDGEFYYINKYKLGYDVDEIVEELIADDRFSNDEKSCIFSDMIHCVEVIFSTRFNLSNYEDCQKQAEFLNNIDWERFIILCKHLIKFAQNYKYENEDSEYDIGCGEKYIAIAEAMLGNEEELLKYIDYIESTTINMIDEFDPAEAPEWKEFTQFYDIADIGKKQYAHSLFMGIGHYANELRNLRRNYLILPALIKCSDALETKINANKDEINSLLRTRSSFKEDMLMYDVNYSGDVMSLMYNWYRTIAEFAINSYLDVGLSNKKGAQYFETYTKYLHKMKALMDKTYAFINYTSRSNNEIEFAHYYCQHENISSICIEYYVQLFSTGIDVNDFNAMIRDDERLSHSNIIAIYSQIAYKAFERYLLHIGNMSDIRKYIEEYDWNRLERLLDAEEDYYLETVDLDKIDDLNVLCEITYNDGKCTMYRALVYAILNDIESFKTHMKFLMDYFKTDFDKSKGKLHWSFYTEYDDIRRIDSSDSFVGMALQVLSDIEKSHLALPYVIECADYIHTYLKTLSNYSEHMMYNWYKIIAEFAFESEDDFDTYMHYQDKVDEMSNKDYEINFDNV